MIEKINMKIFNKISILNRKNNNKASRNKLIILNNSNKKNIAIRLLKTLLNTNNYNKMKNSNKNLTNNNKTIKTNNKTIKTFYSNPKLTTIMQPYLRYLNMWSSCKITWTKLREKYKYLISRLLILIKKYINSF